jgi:hypothetical protein
MDKISRRGCECRFCRMFLNELIRQLRIRLAVTRIAEFPNIIWNQRYARAEFQIYINKIETNLARQQSSDRRLADARRTNKEDVAEKKTIFIHLPIIEQQPENRKT